MRRGNDFWQGTISCGLAVAPGFIPGASWPAPPPTTAGHKARRYNRLRPPEKLATPAEMRRGNRADASRDRREAHTYRRLGLYQNDPQYFASVA